MPSTPLILNEWVIHDLYGENGVSRQMETYQFLVRVEGKCDHLVLLRGSPWMTKAYKLMKEPSANLRLISKFLRNTFLFNASKCRIVETNEIPALPSDLQSIVPSDDSYLISLQMLVPKSILVTTDEKLITALSSKPHFVTCLRDEFIKNYM